MDDGISCSYSYLDTGLTKRHNYPSWDESGPIPRKYKPIPIHLQPLPCHGSGKRRSGSAKRRSGSAKRRSGSAKRRSGSAKRRSGSAKRRSGSGKRRSRSRHGGPTVEGPSDGGDRWPTMVLGEILEQYVLGLSYLSFGFLALWALFSELPLLCAASPAAISWLSGFLCELPLVSSFLNYLFYYPLLLCATSSLRCFFSQPIPLWATFSLSQVSSELRLSEPTLLFPRTLSYIICAATLTGNRQLHSRMQYHESGNLSSCYRLVHIFRIASSKCGPRLWWFWHYILIELSPQYRALLSSSFPRQRPALANAQTLPSQKPFRSLQFLSSGNSHAHVRALLNARSLLQWSIASTSQTNYSHAFCAGEFVNCVLLIDNCPQLGCFPIKSLFIINHQQINVIFAGDRRAQFGRF